MATLDEGEDRYLGLDVDSILSRVESRPLTFHRKRSLNRAPEFVKRLTGEQTVDEGQDVHFDCKVDGFPKPSVRWFKDDQELVDHPRIHWQVREDGSFTLSMESVTKGDEAAYRCRAENVEGQTSCTFFLSVKGKPKSSRRAGRTLGKRTVSYPPMFTTIVEKVEEEEKAARESAKEPPSPLTELYNGTTLKQRGTWPNFLGEWAFKQDHFRHRTGSAGSVGSCGSVDSEADEDVFDVTSCLGGGHHDDVFTEGNEGEGVSFSHHRGGGTSTSSDATPKTNSAAPAFIIGDEFEQDGGTDDVTAPDADQDQDAGQGRQLGAGRGQAGGEQRLQQSKISGPAIAVGDSVQKPAQDAGKKADLKESILLAAKDTVIVANDRVRGQTAREEPEEEEAWDARQETPLAKEPNNNDARLTAGCRAKDAGKITKAVISSGSESVMSAPAKTATATLPKAAQNNMMTSSPVSADAATLNDASCASTMDCRGQLSTSLVSGPRARAPSPSPARIAHHARPLQVVRRTDSEDKAKDGSKVKVHEIMFLLCLWTFAALCFGVPSGKFVMLVLSVEIMYWVAYAFGVC